MFYFKKNKFVILLVFILVFNFIVFNFVEAADSGPDPLTAALKVIATLLFGAVFTFLAALTLLAISIMLLIRYVYLTILLILSPIVWLLWIFPATQQHWKKWWSEFLRWTFFAPIMLFFVFLTLAVINQYPEMLLQSAKGIPANNVGNVSVERQPFAIDMAFIGQLVAILGLLMGGLIAANSMGIAGANIAMNLAKRAGKGVGAWAGRKGLGEYSRLAGAAKWGDKSAEASEIATNSSGIKKLYYGFKARTYANLSAPVEREPERYKSEVSKLTMNQAKAKMSSSGMMFAGEKVALSEHIGNNFSKMRMSGATTTKREKLEEEMEDVYESKVSKDSEGNLITEKIKTGQRPTGKKIGTGEYEDYNNNNELRRDWLGKALGNNSVENAYKRSNMDYNNLLLKTRGESKEMIDAENEYKLAADGSSGKAIALDKFEKAANKLYGRLKKSDSAITGKGLAGFYDKPISFRDSDEASLAHKIAVAISKNIPLIPSMSSNMGYKAAKNFRIDLEGADKSLKNTLNTISKNMEIFESMSSAMPTSAKPASSK